MPLIVPNLPDPERPVLIAGPTASGKSALALSIAEAQGRAIVNADALQVHDSWQALSARPSPEETARAPHLLYGHVPRGADYSVGHWLRELAACLRIHPNAVIVGGTGLYFTALTEGLAPVPPVSAAIRLAAQSRMQAEGSDALLAELDPATAARIDLRNPARVRRAWEVLHSTGKGLAEWQDRTDPPLLPLRQATPLLLMPDRDRLATRINRRFAEMLRAGAVEEARAALPHWPVTPTMPLWTRAIGAAELIAYLRGQISLQQAEAAATLATRRYAKRQRTWFRSRMRTWHTLVPF